MLRTGSVKALMHTSALARYVHVPVLTSSSFHIIHCTCIPGQAASSLKHQASPVAATKKTRTIAKRRDSKAKTSDVHEEELGDKGPLETSGGSEARPSTPPPKDEAFEQFKRERGSEINKILLLNKG